MHGQKHAVCSCTEFPCSNIIFYLYNGSGVDFNGYFRFYSLLCPEKTLYLFYYDSR